MTPTESIPKNTDTNLVQAAQAGNDEAFAELMHRHRANCVKLAESILRSQDDAEDEVQNALWNAYRYLDRFQFESQFSTWLNRIVINQCLMRLRSDKRLKLFYLEDVTIGEKQGTLELRDSRSTPEQALVSAELESAVRAEIRRIPPLLRTVLELKDLEQRPLSEVAAMLGLTVAAVKSRLLRARRELKTRMLPHTGRLGGAVLLAEMGG